MQLSEGFWRVFGSAGVSSVLLCAFTPRKPTGGTPALPKTSPDELKCVVPSPPMRLVVRIAGQMRSVVAQSKAE
jgi:hypothetical protein